MVPTEAERLATIEQVLRDMRDDLAEIHRLRSEAHGRLRALELASAALLEDAKTTRRARDVQLRQLTVRIQWLALAVAAGMFVLVLLATFVHH